MHTRSLCSLSEYCMNSTFETENPSCQPCTQPTPTKCTPPPKLPRLEERTSVAECITLVSVGPVNGRLPPSLLHCATARCCTACKSPSWQRYAHRQQRYDRSHKQLLQALIPCSCACHRAYVLLQPLQCTHSCHSVCSWAARGSWILASGWSPFTGAGSC
jgi:hypothetical protein